MTINELKKRVGAYRDTLKSQSGKTCLFSETGPANMGLIEDLVRTLEAQEKRIAELEKGLRFT